MMWGMSSPRHFVDSKIDNVVAAASVKEDVGDFSVETFIVWGIEVDFTYQ